MRIMIFIAVFFSGIASLQMELSLLREATFRLGSTAITNSFIISIFLAGLAFGSFFGNQIAKNPERSRSIFIISQIINILVVIGFVMTKGYFVYEAKSNLSVITYFGIMTIIPATVAGMSFALFVNMLFGYGEKYISWVYAISTVGNVLSGFAHGLIFVPYFGMATTYGVAIFSTGIAIFCIIGTSIFSRAVTVTATLVLAFVAISIQPIPGIAKSKILYSKDDIYGLVQVIDYSDQFESANSAPPIDVQIHGDHNCSNSAAEFEWHFDSVTYAMELLDDNATTSLNLGYCSGSSVARYLDYPDIEKVTSIELNKTVLEASNIYFPEINQRIAADGRSEVIIDEFRSWLRRNTQLKFDVVMVDISIRDPYYYGMFTREFFQEIKDRLNDKGVLFWHYPDFLHTGIDVFEHVYTVKDVDKKFYYFTNFKIPEHLSDKFEEVFPLENPGIVYSDHKVYGKDTNFFSDIMARVADGVQER